MTESRLFARVKALINENKIKGREVLQVKLTGDGTRVCRKLILLNEGDLVKSFREKYTITILKNIKDLKIS